jgi:hypothetical protein
MRCAASIYQVTGRKYQFPRNFGPGTNRRPREELAFIQYFPCVLPLLDRLPPIAIVHESNDPFQDSQCPRHSPLPGLSGPVPESSIRWPSPTVCRSYTGKCGFRDGWGRVEQVNGSCNFSGIKPLEHRPYDRDAGCPGSASLHGALLGRTQSTAYWVRHAEYWTYAMNPTPRWSIFLRM